MLEKNKSSLLLTLGTTVLLIGGGVTAYWFLSQRRQLEDIPVGANIIPDTAVFTASISTDSDQWQQLRQFGTKQTQAELDKYLAELRERWLTANGYNYESDIQPWIGKEATVAFLPPLNQPPANTNQQQPVVMVLPIANQAAAQQVWENQANTQGKWIDRDYKGIQIREKNSTGQNFSAAVLDQRFIVVSNQPQATESAIDAYQDGASLAKTPGYTQELSKISQPNRFAQLYINVPVAAKVAAANPTQPVPPVLAQLQQNQGLATTVTLESEGMRFESISWLRPNSQRVYQVENQADQMPNRLPAETLIMLSGGNLQQLWQDYSQGTQANSLAPIQPEELRSGVESLTGLDLDQDLLSWMKGKFALSVIPAAPKAGTPEDFALSLVLLVETSDRSAAETAFQRLDGVMRSKYQFQVQQTQVDGQPLINWIAPFGTLTATHGWLNENVAFFALGAPVAERLLPQPATTLAGSEQFQQTVPTELKPYNGQFFLNVEPTLKTLPLPQLFTGQQTLLAAMRSLGVTTAVSDQRSIRYDIFIALKQVAESETSPSLGDRPQISPTPSP